jgi:hypothetical protein
MRYHDTANSFRLVSKSNTTLALVELYRIKNGTPASTLTLNEKEGLGDVKYSGNVKLNRTFENGYYNTLVLPFAVDNPQTVFGSQTSTFEISASTDTTITFRKMSASETLKANTPYLINGTFTTPPYIINKVEIRPSEIRLHRQNRYRSSGLAWRFQKAICGWNTGFHPLSEGFLLLHESADNDCKPL